ncbi:MAG: glutathione S-transferase family protein [Candidatus Binatia bacterium]
MPKELGQRARVRIWIDFCNTRLQQAASEVRHGNEPEKAREKLREYLNTLDQEMAKREYIAGNYSLADITYIPFFVRQERYGISFDNNLPHLKAWMDRLLARPGVSSTL